MSDPQYPNVPDALGVPPVLRHTPNLNPSGDHERMHSDGPGIASKAPTGWGIYAQGGALAIEFDNTVSFEYSAESRIADYPLEKGSFASYDKVAMPYEIRLPISKGGSLADRTSFLSRLESIRTSLDLFNIVTPERTYLNANIMRVALSRNSTNGATLLSPEIVFREIRNTATANYSNSKQASGAAQVNGGSVQVVAPPDGFAPVLEPKPSTFDPATGGLA